MRLLLAVNVYFIKLKISVAHLNQVRYGVQRVLAVVRSSQELLGVGGLDGPVVFQGDFVASLALQAPF